MTNWRSVTDILERMEKLGVPADEAIGMAKALIDIGKAAQVAAEREKRLIEAREAGMEFDDVKADWQAILGDTA
jgi:hypothetical protein